MAVGSIGGTYGLSGSGMDIDSLVKKLMAGQQAKEDALMQKKTVTEWQKSAYNTVYDSISSFRNTVFDYSLQNMLSPKKVTSSDSSVATVTANADAAQVNHSLIVAQLASGVNLTSTAAISTGSDKSTLASQMGVANSFSLKIDNGSASASINVNPTDSIYDVVSAINKAGINVRASYDSTLDRFFLSTTNMGADTGINITATSINAGGTDDGGNFIQGLHLFTAAPATTTSTDGTNTTTVSTFTGPTGKDAVFQLDGVSLTKASNSFTISGVSYNLNGVSSGTLATDVQNHTFSGQASSISVSNDIDAAVKSIQNLIDSYNKILEDINGKLDETRYSDYKPLTDEQKTQMKDSDITLWNEKAKSGMLRHDDILTSLVYTLRNSFANPISGVSGKYRSASSIGITTASYAEGGKLHLDTDKLKTALQENPDVLEQLFGGDNGIAQKLYDGIKTTMDKLAQKAGTTGTSQYDTKSSLAILIADYDKQIDVVTERYNTMQSAYYTRFNAMEVALQQLSQQSSWLSSQFSSSQG